MWQIGEVSRTTHHVGSKRTQQPRTTRTAVLVHLTPYEESASANEMRSALAHSGTRRRTTPAQFSLVFALLYLPEIIPECSAATDVAISSQTPSRVWVRQEMVEGPIGPQKDVKSPLANKLKSRRMRSGNSSPKFFWIHAECVRQTLESQHQNAHRKHPILQ